MGGQIYTRKEKNYPIFACKKKKIRKKKTPTSNTLPLLSIYVYVYEAKILQKKKSIMARQRDRRANHVGYVSSWAFGLQV